ncbi:MAG: hypothetical protein KDC38_14570, partial [Planctomycetes bacterium]|nr:hypothetical protein [Planctomycetota bacterium]
MTAPDPVVPNASLLSTPRILDGRFFLRPDPVVNRTVRYFMALTAQECKIDLYAYSVLSNQMHVAFFDRHRRHPDFRRDFHSMTTRAINKHRGEWGQKWDTQHKSVVLLC